MEFEHATRNKSHVPIFVVFCVSCVDLGPFRPVLVDELSVVVHSVLGNRFMSASTIVRKDYR